MSITFALRARSSARLEHRTFNPGVTGSIPVGPAMLFIKMA
jgi:hypothetical protein